MPGDPAAAQDNFQIACQPPVVTTSRYSEINARDLAVATADAHPMGTKTARTALEYFGATALH
jgi:hypothetical protein